MNITDVAQYGIAVVLVAYMAWRDKLLNKTLQNHFDHSELAFKSLIEVVEKNTSALTKFEIKRK